MNNDPLIQQLQEEARKVRECQARWKEGFMQVVCGAPYPCSQHTSQEERDKWVDSLIATAVQKAREESKKDREMWLREEIVKLKGMKKYMHLQFEGCADYAEAEKRKAYNIQYTQTRIETLQTIIDRYQSELDHITTPTKPEHE